MSVIGKHQYCLSTLRFLSAWCRFVLDDLWNTVVCFQPPSLLIGKVWVPVMHFCACPMHCRVHWRVGRRLGSCRLTSVQPLSTIWAVSISSALWVLEVLSCQYWHSFYQTDHRNLCDSCRSKLLYVVSGVHQGSVLGRFCSSCTRRSFFPFWKKSWLVMVMTPLW